MEIKPRLYPYPVLQQDSDDYIDSYFEFFIDQNFNIDNKNQLSLDISFNLNNPELMDMINNGILEFLVHIECSRTSFRQAYTTSKSNIHISIDEKNLNGLITICGFIVVKKDLVDFSNNNFNSDYEGLSFNLKKGNIVAIGGQYNLDLPKTNEELAKIPSIFSICKQEIDDEELSIDLMGDKIIITLSENSFNNYKILSQGSQNSIHILNSILIVPTLIYIIETLRQEGIEQFQDNRWFMVLSRAFEKHNLELNSELLNKDSYKLVNLLLENPFSRAFQAMSYEEEEE